MPRMRNPASIRASDSEREHAVSVLRRHYAEGRLSAPELEQRATRAYTSRRRGELAAVLIDLPLSRSGRWTREGLARGAGRIHRFLLRGHAATYACINAMLAGIWVLTGEGAFWPALYLVPSTALLAWHWAGGRMISRAFARSQVRSRTG